MISVHQNERRSVYSTEKYGKDYRSNNKDTQETDYVGTRSDKTQMISFSK